MTNTAAMRELGCYHSNEDECDCPRCEGCGDLGNLTRDWRNDLYYCEDCFELACTSCEQYPCMCGAGDYLGDEE